MLLRIDVLKEDMKAAEPDGCLIEQALLRITGLEWLVDFEEAGVLETDPPQWIRLPDPIINKLADWDGGITLDPFSFDLLISDEIANLIREKEKEKEEEQN